MRKLVFIVAATLIGVFLLAGPASATVLLFESASGGSMNPAEIDGPIGIDSGYGSNITSASQGGYGYLQGFGWTPHVGVSYGSSIYAVNATMGGLTRFVYGDTGGNYASITLTADAGYQVRLDSFDLGINISPALAVSVQILGSNNQVLWSLGADAAIGGPTPGPNPSLGTAFFFPNVTSTNGGSLTLEWKSNDLTHSTAAIAVDNVNFSQIPEPGTLVLLGLGGAALLARRKRRLG